MLYLACDKDTLRHTKMREPRQLSVDCDVRNCEGTASIHNRGFQFRMFINEVPCNILKMDLHGSYFLSTSRMQAIHAIVHETHSMLRAFFQ